jgi:hypothetical protein
MGILIANAILMPLILSGFHRPPGQKPNPDLLSPHRDMPQ